MFPCTHAEKTRFLKKIGFKRLILARELSLVQIAAIRTDGRHRYRLEFACDRCEMEVWLTRERPGSAQPHPPGG